MQAREFQTVTREQEKMSMSVNCRNVTFFEYVPYSFMWDIQKNFD